MGNAGMGVNLCEDRGTVCSVCKVDIQYMNHPPFEFDSTNTTFPRHLLGSFSYVLSILNVPSHLLSRCTGNAVEVNDRLLAHVEPDRLLLQSASSFLPVFQTKPHTT